MKKLLLLILLFCSCFSLTDKEIADLQKKADEQSKEISKLEKKADDLKKSKNEELQKITPPPPEQR